MSRGFSLIELLIVIVIIGLLAAVSVPWFGKIRRRSELRSAAMEIGTTLVAARMRAVRSNAPATVQITAASGGETLHEIDTIQPTPAVTPAFNAANPGSPLFLSARAIRFVTTPTGGSIAFDGSGRRLAPVPPTPASFVIEGPVGIGPTNQITIDTSDAGRVRIVTPVVWQ